MLLVSRDEYIKALHAGQKDMQERRQQGKDPYPAVLDELLPDLNRYTVNDLPVQEIPVRRIIGTKSAGRISAFSAGFLPVLPVESEFAAKWMALADACVSDEGIRDPISCYEYLGDFYVLEGNKRTSVLRAFGAVRIPARIRRILPEKSGEPRIQAYYEFLDFYRCAGIYDLQFTVPGRYARLLKAIGKKENEEWSEKERRHFLSGWAYFLDAFQSLGEKAQGAAPEEALLLWLEVHPYEELFDLTAKELKQTLSDLSQDIFTMAGSHPTVLPEVPAEKNLLEKLTSSAPSRLQVAFLYERDPESSSWSSAHARGAAELKEALGDKVSVREYSHADTPEKTEELLEKAVSDGAELIFTTTPLQRRSALKAALHYPKLRFLNCSVDDSLSSVRSYYCRTYEGKFITGVIAGALARGRTIGYIGSYPVPGVPASVNAFALGARMVDPDARIRLVWNCVEKDPVAALRKEGIEVISHRDIPLAETQYIGPFGLAIYGEGGCQGLASPHWHWGRVYENIVRTVLGGNWTPKKEANAINYWWGMDSGAVDVKMTDTVPEGTALLAKTLMADIRDKRLSVFRRPIVTQDGTVISDGSRELDALELLRMDWLCDNIEGSIPQYGELLPMSRPLVREFGIYKDRIRPEEEDA